MLTKEMVNEFGFGGCLEAAEVTEEIVPIQLSEGITPLHPFFASVGVQLSLLRITLKPATISALLSSTNDSMSDLANI